MCELCVLIQFYLWFQTEIKVMSSMIEYRHMKSYSDMLQKPSIHRSIIGKGPHWKGLENSFSGLGVLQNCKFK